MLICTLMVLTPDAALHAQPAPTVIPNDFDRYDLFEYQLIEEWYFLPESSNLSAEEALASVDSFTKPTGETMAGWWMLRLINQSSTREFALRLPTDYDRLEVVKKSSDGSIEKDWIGLQIVKGGRVQDRLMTTTITVDGGSEVMVLIKEASQDIKVPKVTLSSLSAVEDYSASYERLSLIFTVVFLFILLYQLGTLSLIRSRSYIYYSMLAAGYLLHAINYLLDGWTTTAFANDFSILSASLICVAGICLWRRFLNVEEGVWLWLFHIMKMLGMGIMALVLAYLIFPSYLPRLNKIATISAALLAMSVIGVWIVSSIVMSIQGRENARSYSLTNIPLLAGGLFFMTVWISVRYGWISSVGTLPILTNYVFFGSAAAQCLLFSLVIGITLKKRLVGSYKTEKKQKELFEDRVKERTEELEKINDQLSQKNKELEKTNGTKNRLLTILSHDLRSPINNVASLVALLKEHQFSPEEFSSLIPDIEKSISDTTNFMSLLIRWTQSQNDGLIPNKSKFEIQSVIDRNIRHLGSALEAKQLELKVDADGIQVFADQNMMDLVVRNLLSNAIKFSHPSGKIQINATNEADEEVRIQVVDEGVGIDDSRTKLFFDVTQKNTMMGTGGEKGFGMGLILSKDFAELNGGTLSFTSKRGKGSTFTVTIPS